ncbi:MAG: type II toxin-antitoxin system prevent-host-death family antitoxin [Thiohalocapsa sp. PB-PSB1]|jgi:prevent-host-death family protein|nr:MAG: type II toxin-antitoxin system prevent-host-death family antitoxin [Thiohalocapsa sp. PB-PSB1]QQO55828.1 MAG: type II toxin-antitoxin system prevent-host-death family antitoxin [Thiohalocapsa sp. PB-PSB1]
MQELVSIRDANQHLSRYLERVQDGAEFVITRRGKPIARLLPIPTSGKTLSDAQSAARERLRARMRRGYALGGLSAVRDELHER